MNILVLDDEAEIADLVELFLKNEGYNVYKFYSSSEAIKCINSTPLDLALLDVMLPRYRRFYHTSQNKRGRLPLSRYYAYG